MRNTLILSVCFSALLAGCALAPQHPATGQTADTISAPGSLKKTPLKKASLVGGESIYATTSVVKPVRELPVDLENKELSIYQGSPVAFDVFVQKIADAIGSPVLIEERQARDGKNVRLPTPPKINGPWVGKLRQILNQLLEVSGYSWDYDVKEKKIRLYRYHDQETVSNTSPQKSPITEKIWWVRPDKNPSLKSVLQTWAKQAGWQVTWPIDVPDYKVGQPASYNGTFEEAVGQLLYASISQPQPIAPIAYTQNRQIEVVKQK